MICIVNEQQRELASKERALARTNSARRIFKA